MYDFMYNSLRLSMGPFFPEVGYLKVRGMLQIFAFIQQCRHICVPSSLLFSLLHPLLCSIQLYSWNGFETLMVIIMVAIMVPNELLFAVISCGINVSMECTTEPRSCCVDDQGQM